MPINIHVDVHIHTHPDQDTAERLGRIEQMLGVIDENQERIMATFEELKSALDASDVKIDAVKADIQTLMDKLAAIPQPGLTPEQQQALNDAVDHAKAINEKLGAIDAMNP